MTRFVKWLQFWWFLLKHLPKLTMTTNSSTAALEWLDTRWQPQHSCDLLTSVHVGYETSCSLVCTDVMGNSFTDKTRISIHIFVNPRNIYNWQLLSVFNSKLRRIRIELTITVNLTYHTVHQISLNICI